ncbi:MAG: glycosyltransferase family 4 protein [Candidatus Dormibacteria bacterium]
MRVHYHTDCYWFGGSEVVLLLHVEAAFASTDIEPTFTYRAGRDYETGLRAQVSSRVRATRLRLPDPADLKQALTRGRTPRTARVIRGGISLLPLRQLCMAWDIGRFYKAFRAERPDVVHINNGGYPGAISCSAAAIAARLASVPAVVYVVNNIAVPYERPSRVLDYPIDRMVVRSVDVFVTASRIASSALESVLRLPPAQHTVIPNAAAAGDGGSRESARHALGIPKDRLVLLVMARLEQRKGHAVLLDAIPLLPPGIRDRVLVLIAGDGPEKEGLRQRAEALNIGACVQFLGHREDRWSLYAAADIIVLPSISHEDMPIVIIDAMAASRPVVATRVAGIPEQVVDEVTGRLVPPGDSAELANAIAAVLADDEGRARMGIAARERYEANYTPQGFVDAYRRVYAAVLARKRGDVSHDAHTTERERACT